MKLKKLYHCDTTRNSRSQLKKSQPDFLKFCHRGSVSLTQQKTVVTEWTKGTQTFSSFWFYEMVKTIDRGHSVYKVLKITIFEVTLLSWLDLKIANKFSFLFWASSLRNIFSSKKVTALSTLKVPVRLRVDGTCVTKSQQGRAKVWNENTAFKLR